MKSGDRRLGQILIEMGIATVSQVLEALEVQRQRGGAIGEVLVSLGYITREHVVQALRIQMGMS